MKEIWKDIKGYEGLYMVSNLGRIKSIDRTVIQQGREQKYSGRIIQPYVNNSGYLMVSISRGNNKKRFTVHYLVASAFIPNPHNFPQINHINENKLDNNVSNLEWCSIKYNINYGTCTYRRAIKMGKGVARYKKDGQLVDMYYSIHEACRKTGIARASISSCLKGRMITAGNCFWKIIEENIPVYFKPIDKLRNNCAREVRQYDRGLNLIAVYKSGREAAQKTGFNHENICACCRGEALSCGGFIWRYGDDKPMINIRKNQHEVIQYDLNMNEIQRFDSIASASKYLGGKKDAGIKQCVYGRNKTAYGFIWRYSNGKQ